MVIIINIDLNIAVCMYNNVISIRNHISVLLINPYLYISIYNQSITICFLNQYYLFTF